MSLRERVRSAKLWTYRHPYTWTAIKRGAVVGAAVGGLALSARRARLFGEQAHAIAHTLHNERQVLRRAKGYAQEHVGSAPSFAEAWRRHVEVESAFGPGSPVLKRAARLKRQARRFLRKGKVFRLAAHRRATAAGVLGAAGAAWTAMPWAIKRGGERNLERQRRQLKPLPVIHKRGGRIVQVRYL